MKLRKIKDLRKGNRQEKTEKQIAAASKAATIMLLTNNPMKNKNIPKRVRRHTTTKHPFKKGNNLKGFKGKNHSEKTKLIIGMKNSGKKRTEEHKQKAREMFIKNNPMKNPENVKRYKESRKKNKIRKKKVKLRKKVLNNKNSQKNWFKPKVLITDQLKTSIISYYKNGRSLLWLQNKTKLYRGTIRKILVSEGIKIRDLAFYSKHRNKKEVK